MNEQRQTGNTPDPGENYTPLAHWLQQVLQTTPQPAPPKIEARDNQLALLFDSTYHLSYYQQLPDFIMALLNNDSQATAHYAPLLYHMAGCPECHAAYLDLYDAMREAVQPMEPRPVLGQGTRTLNAMPQRMLGHLCRLSISQAEALWRQERHEESDTSAAARSLLQLALRVSAPITQNAIRREALQDLVRVATLFEKSEEREQAGNGLSYTPTLTGVGGMQTRKVVRRAESTTRSPHTSSNQPVIQLKAQKLDGYITQNGQVLELHLQDLDEQLRGKHLSLSVPLGSLLEPVRWSGGNPHRIRSKQTVDASGSITLPLGETALLLSNAEEYHLLEAMFMLVEVRGENS